jgi:hypothetical protein
MLHLYAAALFTVIAANAVIVVIAVAIRRVERRQRWPRGLATFALGIKKRGDPCKNPSLSTRRLRQSGSSRSIPEGSLP